MLLIYLKPPWLSVAGTRRSAANLIFLQFLMNGKLAQLQSQEINISLSYRFLEEVKLFACECHK